MAKKQMTESKPDPLSPFVPSIAEVDASSEAGADPKTLCVNWRQGCNGVTDGPRKGRLQLCDDCDKELVHD